MTPTHSVCCWRHKWKPLWGEDFCEANEREASCGVQTQNKHPNLKYSSRVGWDGKEETSKKTKNGFVPQEKIEAGKYKCNIIRLGIGSVRLHEFNLLVFFIIYAWPGESGIGIWLNFTDLNIKNSKSEHYHAASRVRVSKWSATLIQ